MKEFKIDKLFVSISDTRSKMGDRAGTDIANFIKQLLKTQPYVNIIFGAAPSQNETLAKLCNEDGVDWSRVNAFHMDEYIGLDPAHPAGFRNFLKRAIFDRLNFHNVFLINGNAENIEDEIERYSKLLKEYPVDIVALGVGENGHIAFNDPGVADFNDSKLVKCVELDQRCRKQQVNDGCFERVEDVPRYALTLTVPALFNARKMVCTVPSETKAEAVYNMLNGEISPACPASVMRCHDCASMYLDRDSASRLSENR